MSHDSDYILSYLKNQLSKNKLPSENPKAFLLGGQSGAGKGQLAEHLAREMNYNAIIINGDDYRQFHPDINDLYRRYREEWVAHTSAFSGKMTEDLIDYFSDQRYSMIIEGTLRTSEVPQRTAELLKSKGYETELDFLAVKPEISFLSTQIRYFESIALGRDFPRSTKKNTHYQIFENLLENIDRLFRLQIFQKMKVYDREHSVVHEGVSQNPRNILENFYNSPFHTKEKTEIEHLMDYARKLLTHPRLQHLIPEYYENIGEVFQTNELDAERILERLKSVKPTIYIDTDERNQLRRRISEEMLKEKEDANADKRIDFVIGLPGSGKSTVISIPIMEQYNSLLIDSDEAKKKLPEYNRGLGADTVHLESRVIFLSALEKALSEGKNIVLQGTGKDLEQLLKIYHMAKNFGYQEQHLHLCEIPLEVSIERSMKRFIEDGRYVSPETIMEMGDKPKRNYEQLKDMKLFKSYEVYDNNVKFGEKPILIERTAKEDLYAGEHSKNTGLQLSEKDLRSMEIRDFEEFELER